MSLISKIQNSYEDLKLRVSDFFFDLRHGASDVACLEEAELMEDEWLQFEKDHPEEFARRNKGIRLAGCISCLDINAGDDLLQKIFGDELLALAKAEVQRRKDNPNWHLDDIIRALQSNSLENSILYGRKEIAEAKAFIAAATPEQLQRIYAAPG